MKSIAYLAMDVHGDSISGALLPSSGDEFITERKIRNDKLTLKKWISKWDQVYELRCCYEASSCGYVVHRWLAEMGIKCDVIAPSLIPTKPGDKLKTDRRDARKLAKLYRAGELTPVHVPDEGDEAVRALVRCRETVQKEVLSSRHYILKFLSLRGLSYRGGKNWTREHWRYLRSIKLEGADEIVFRNYMSLLEFKLEQLKALDMDVEAVACSDKYREVVGRLLCLRGVGVLTAMVIVSEVQDFARFAGPRELMAYFGIVPSENSSGDVRRQGQITKTGNSRVRRVLIEAAWHYRHKPAIGDRLKKRQEGQRIEVIAHAWKAQHRLYKKFWSIANRKETHKAVVAVARELVGFIWALVIRYDTATLSAA